MSTNLDRALWPAATFAFDADLEDLMQTWHDAREDASDAYSAWERASVADRPAAYSVYVAAGDREAAAESLCLAALQLR
jgi:hypothetical protein